MKTTPEPTDRDIALGTPIREVKPAPAPTPVAPGVVRNPNGTLETRITPAPIWTPPPIQKDGQTNDWPSPDILGDGVNLGHFTGCARCGAPTFGCAGVEICSSLDCRG